MEPIIYYKVDPAELLHLNNLKSQLKVLEPGREVLVPTKFSCLGQFFQAAFNYTVQENSTVDLSDIACRIFEGLAKPGTLFEENTSEENNVEMGTKLRVPLKCACPDNFSNGSGVKYLVTYPLVEDDEPSILSEIFSISPVDLWVANNFQPWPTIYPNTTVFIPLKIDPVINFSINALHLQWLHGLLVGSNGRSSPLSFPTPSSPRSGQLAESDYSWSDLVFELPGNGCLRDLLSNSSNPLRWDKRTEIAFDIATGLHYLHYCIFPTYAHSSVSSRNIYVTTDWRAKMTNIRANPAAVSSRGTENIENVKGWAAPEYIVDGSVSEKLDIFAFGVALLELISGKDDVDGKSFKECITFLGGKTIEGGCFDGMRSLKEDYPLPEALCLAVLAKACVDEEDPLHRPCIDDILKVLVRMVR
ncbi:LYSM-DOMAIN RECEPTOR-LIKE KINASE [Salix koriyanagi]|uniref:LYSM-DOMAIN RECEPTOR-LIKE KINASE n=1 Tax=Salix koriyanagi TaxID=2511006 RepID=A0A9Q0TQ28_9ROSI|nr:LYSM-DOMAIN RECEPTOR-LIKE KINASE [Salix koriyanagi]